MAKCPCGSPPGRVGVGRWEASLCGEGPRHGHRLAPPTHAPRYVLLLLLLLRHYLGVRLDDREIVVAGSPVEMAQLQGTVP